MNIKKRNRNNVLSRWKKVQEKEKKYINKNKNNNLRSRIHGFLVGDGNILKSNNKTCFHNTVRFFPDHISMVKSFNEAFKKIYNKKPKVVQKKNYYWVTVDSKVIVEDLLNISKFSKLKWEVPYSIFLNKKNKIEWLRAYFDCEAYINPKYIMVKSVNKKGLYQVKDILKDFSINSKIYSYKPKNKNWNVNYMLIINRKDDREKYRNFVGFNHTIKLKKLNETLIK